MHPLHWSLPASLWLKCFILYICQAICSKEKAHWQAEVFFGRIDRKDSIRSPSTQPLLLYQQQQLQKHKQKNTNKPSNKDNNSGIQITTKHGIEQYGVEWRQAVWKYGSMFFYIHTTCSLPSGCLGGWPLFYLVMDVNVKSYFQAGMMLALDKIAGLLYLFQMIHWNLFFFRFPEYISGRVLQIILGKSRKISYLYKCFWLYKWGSP